MSLQTNIQKSKRQSVGVDRQAGICSHGSYHIPEYSKDCYYGKPTADMVSAVRRAMREGKIKIKRYPTGLNSSGKIVTGRLPKAARHDSGLQSIFSPKSKP